MIAGHRGNPTNRGFKVSTDVKVPSIIPIRLIIDRVAAATTTLVGTRDISSRKSWIILSSLEMGLQYAGAGVRVIGGTTRGTRTAR